MKLFPILLAASVVGAPAMAHHRHSWIVNEYDYIQERDRHTCTKLKVEVTQYSDGTSVKNFRRLPWRRCLNGWKHHHHHHHRHIIKEDQYPNVGRVDEDGNSCAEGSILGGIAGAGLGAALSRGDGRLWGIPAGIVGGALVGCQIDGG